ncbi:hypothetical protein DFJ74DRAFT_229836 [Hyaloraphidium curvatum]|nr:hypothetical protein DFJ74DRAFT_229836 [Hyaloraphidium curvatum]
MLATAGGAGAHTPGSGGRLEGPPALSEGLQKRGRTLRVDQSLRELLAQLDEDAEPTELSATDLGFDYDAASAPANGLEPNLLASMSGSSRVVGAMERTRLARPGRTEAQHGPVPTKSSGHDKLELNDSELRDFEEGGETVLVNSFSDMGSFRRDTDTFAGLAPSRTAVGAGFAGHRSSDAHPGAGSSSGTYAASHGGVSPSTATAYVDGQTGNLGSNGRASRALDERQATQFVGHNAPRNPLHAEISRLQAANDKLAAHLLETRRALDGALYEKERAVLEVEAEWQTRCEDIKHANDEEFAALRDRIAECSGNPTARPWWSSCMWPPRLSRPRRR